MKMKHTTKRILILLLAVCMTIVLLPGVVFSATAQEDDGAVAKGGHRNLLVDVVAHISCCFLEG